MSILRFYRFEIFGGGSRGILQNERFQNFPKLRSCNNMLDRLNKSGQKEVSLRFFEDLVVLGLWPSVYTS
jgi:hypothetical protein